MDNIMKGESEPARVYTVLSTQDIKAIRGPMSQVLFAKTFNISLQTLKGWECGRRHPNQSATNYLRIIKADPKFVQQALVA